MNQSELIIAIIIIDCFIYLALSRMSSEDESQRGREAELEERRALPGLGCWEEAGVAPPTAVALMGVTLAVEGSTISYD